MTRTRLSWAMAEPLLSFFVSVATALGNLTNWFLGRSKNERELVAAYFDEIAACLKEVAERIEAGDAPRDTCARLAVFVDEIESILKGRGYVTAAGDVSIDETRMRLAGELMKTQILWSPADDPDPTELAADDLRREVAVTALRHGSPFLERVEPPAATVDRVETELTQHAAAATPNVQPIWDAAGQFAGLAATIRAR